MTRKEWKAHAEADRFRIIPNYGCDCVEQVLRHANLPEYRAAISTLRHYADGGITKRGQNGAPLVPHSSEIPEETRFLLT